jgi:uncharacterized protein
MSIKSKLQEDYVNAVKTKTDSKVRAIRSIKTKISEAEKANKNQELNDNDVIKIITKSYKTLVETEKIYRENGREDLADIEKLEAEALVDYLPKQMTKEEIQVIVRELIQKFPEVTTNKNALIGKTMGAFNKEYQGQADPQTLKTIIEEILN